MHVKDAIGTEQHVTL